MRNATPPCLDTFCRLDRLGLSVTVQRVDPDHTVLRCRSTTPLSPCPGCARPGVRHDAVLRRLVHVPLGWKPTILEVVVPRYRCWPCRRTWRHHITAAAPSKGKLSREAIMLAVKSWLEAQTKAFRDRVEIVAMDGFTGYKTAAVETIDTVTTVMDPFHVVALVGDKLDRCRPARPAGDAGASGAFR